MCLSIILLLILGITAVQKSMKLNLAMKMSPSILCAIYINDSLVFNNKTSTIKSGVTLTANTLQLDSTSVFGQTFNLKIENLNEKAICITVSGCTIANNENYSTTLLAGIATDNLAVSSAGTVLIAMEEAVTYQIAFDANGGSGTMDNQTHTYGISANLTANSYVAPEGKMFAGWARSADGEVVYEDGELILNATTISETITLYAVWEDAGYTLTVNVTNGDISELISVDYATVIVATGTNLSATAGEMDGYGRATITGATNQWTCEEGAPYVSEVKFAGGAEFLICTEYANNVSKLGNTFYLANVEGIGEAHYERISFKSLEDGAVIWFGIKFTLTQDTIVNVTVNGEWGGCFPADTLVSSEYSFKNIQDVQIGDMVWTYNEVSGEFELKKVYFTRVVELTTEVIHLGVGDEILTATYNHEFLTKNRGWVSAKDLTLSDILIANGEYLQITSYESEIVKDFYYNFSVEDNHNYLVSDKQIVVDDFYCQEKRWGLVD